MPQIGAIIQLHRGSKRLPEKVYAHLGDKCVIDHVVDRVKEAGIDNIILATNHSNYDYDLCEDAAVRNEVDHAHWAKDWDCLGRLYKTAKEFELDVILRVCSDNPFLDPNLISRLVYYWQTHPEADAVVFRNRNSVRLFTFNALKRMEKLVTYEPSYTREHVIPIVSLNTHVINESVDTQSDLDELRKWYNGFYNR